MVHEWRRQTRRPPRVVEQREHVRRPEAPLDDYDHARGRDERTRACKADGRLTGERYSARCLPSRCPSPPWPRRSCARPSIVTAGCTRKRSTGGGCWRIPLMRRHDTFFRTPRRGPRSGGISVKRRTFIGNTTGALVSLPRLLQAQQAARVFRIGYIGLSAPTPGRPGGSRTVGRISRRAAHSRLRRGPELPAGATIYRRARGADSATGCGPLGPKRRRFRREPHRGDPRR
jgi:hypothetical protein